MANKAILLAPHENSNKTNPLALSLANRSLVWFEKKNWGLAVADIKNCLDEDYPQHLQYKLHIRQVRYRWDKEVFLRKL